MEDAGEAVDGDEVTGRVLDRLRRIRELSGSAPPAEVLGELRELVAEAEEWARLEGDERARLAVAELDEALAAGEVRPSALA